MQDDDLSAKTNLLKSLTSIRKNQESSLTQSVSEKSSSTSSSSFSSITTTMHQQTSSSHEGTTGGNVEPSDEDKKVSLVSPMMELSACPTGNILILQQQLQQQKQSSSIASSSSSIAASPSFDVTRKTKTLSFLHNEDLFASGTSMISVGNSNSSLNSSIEKQLMPTTSHLFRSISFQERHCQQKTSLMRTESERESGETRGVRKMAILSSLQEVNERMKQQQMRMFSESSECSL